MGAPAVSVVMPIWQCRPDHLREAIASVLGQTMDDLELIVVEDPPRIAIDVVAEFDDRRVRHIVNQSRTGLVEQRNRAIAEARGRYIACADGDDISEPHRLATQLSFLERNPEVAVLGAQLTIIDASSRSIGARDYPLEHAAIVRVMRTRNPIAQPSTIARRETVTRAGGYRRLGHGDMAEDYDLWCRLAAQGATFANHPDRLVRYRIHDRASKQQMWRELLRATIAIKREHFGADMTIDERARIIAEQLLLLAPAPLVSYLFSRLSIRPLDAP